MLTPALPLSRPPSFPAGVRKSLHAIRTLAYSFRLVLLAPYARSRSTAFAPITDAAQRGKKVATLSQS